MAQFTEGGIELVTKGYGSFMSNLGRADSKMGAFGRTASGLGGQFKAVGDKVLGLGATMAKVAVTGVAALAGALTGVGVASLKAAIDFESAFAGVLKTTDGLTDEFGNLNAAGQDLQQGFRDLAKETPIAVEELLKIGELGGQLGIAKDDLLDFTATIAAMGVSTNLTTEDAASSLARMANIMGTVEEEGSAAFSKLGSTVVELGNNLATTESEILNFGLRIAGAGEIAGLTEADVLGIGAAMSSVGVQAEAGGTAVQKVLIAMNEAVAGSTSGFVDNTAAIEKNQKKLVDIQADMVRYEAKTGMTEQAMRKLHDEFIAGGGTMEQWGRQLGDTNREHLYNTIVKLDETRNALELLRASQGKAIPVGNLQLFAKVSGRTAAQFKKDWKEDSGKVFEDFIKGLGAAGDDAIGILDKLELKDQRLVRSFLSLANAGDLITESMDLASGAFEDNTALMTEAEKRYKTTESQMQLLKNTIKDVGIGIGSALLPVFNDLMSRFRDFIDQHGPAIQSMFQQIAEWLGTHIPIAIQIVSDFWNNTLSPALTEFWNIIETNVLPILQEIWDWLGEKLPEAIAYVVEHWETFKAALIAMGAALAVIGILTAIGSALALITNPVFLIIAAIGALAAAWQSDWGGIRTTLTEVWNNTLKPAFEDVKAWLSENIPAAIETLKGWWENTFKPALESAAITADQLIQIIGILWDWLMNQLTIAFQAVANWWETTLKPALEAMWAFIQTVLIPIVELLWDWLSQQITAAFQAVADFWENTLKPAFEAIWEFVKETLIPILVDLYDQVKDVAEDALDILTKAFETVKDIMDKVWGVIKEDLLPKLGDLISFIKNTAQGVIDGFSNTINNIKQAFQHVKSAIEKVVHWIHELIDAIASVIIPDWLSGHSPPPAANWFGQIAQGAALAAQAVGAYSAALAGTPRGGVGFGVSSATVAQAMPGVAGGGTTVTNNVTMPITAHIGGEMDMVVFERRVEAAVTKALRYG